MVAEPCGPSGVTYTRRASPVGSSPVVNGPIPSTTTGPASPVMATIGEIVGADLLVAAGRAPNTDDLELDHLGVAPDGRGLLKVDGQLRTVTEDVYRTVFKQEAVFVDPEVASVGLTEQQASDAGHDVAIGTQRLNGVAKAKAIGETDGFITFVVNAAPERVVGCHIVGPGASNLIHEAVIAMVCDVPNLNIGRVTHVHPSPPEGARRRRRRRQPIIRMTRD